MATSMNVLLKITALTALLYLGTIDEIRAQASKALSARQYNQQQQGISAKNYTYTPAVRTTTTPSLKDQLNIKPNPWSPDIFINNEIAEAIGDTVVYIQTLGSRDPASLIYTINSIIIKTWTDPEKDIVINGLNILCTTSGPIKTDEEIAVFSAILASDMKDSLSTKVIEHMQWKAGEKKWDEAEWN